jgi:hypothetical protein
VYRWLTRADQYRQHDILRSANRKLLWLDKLLINDEWLAVFPPDMQARYLCNATTLVLTTDTIEQRFARFSG